MGWWRIGGTDEDPLYNGDGPADIAGEAVEQIIEAYVTGAGRKPYREEVLAVLAFVLGPYFNDGDDEYRLLASGGEIENVGLPFHRLGMMLGLPMRGGAA